jgi:two-component system sensor histidine kinase VanS
MRRLRNTRLPIRARLTVSYAGLVTGCGGVLITIVYLFMRFVPSYRMVNASRLPMTDYGKISPTARPSIALVDSTDDFLRLFLLASLGALLLLAVIGAAVGWIVAGRIIRPLAAINAAAIRAATGTLDHRVALGGPRDEIRDLSDTFDRMLASLERSFAAHRRFAANASHELRTPLATTKTMIDVALGDPVADAAELRALAERIREVNRSNIQTVNALLDLADADGGTSTRQPLDLAEIAGGVVRELSTEARTAGVDLPAPTGEATALGDPILVRQAVSNLVRNAVRYNGPNGLARVRLSSIGTMARVSVVNTGAHVAPESVDVLVEPFVRGTGRTSTRGTGHGLGLAIVSAVARAHDGRLTLNANSDGGLTAHLDIPASGSSPDLPRPGGVPGAAANCRAGQRKERPVPSEPASS